MKRVQTNLIDSLLDTASRNPHRIATWDESREYTFEQLVCGAAALADVLHGLSSETRRVIAVYLPKGVPVTLADFAILMTCNAFMNLDVKTPVDRISNIFTNVEPLVVISNSEGRKALSPILGETPFLEVEEFLASTTWTRPCPTQWHFYGYRPIDADPFCIINTSGSTGTPKGVVTPFRAFNNFVLWTIEKYALRVDEEVSASVSPVFFDAFVLEMLLMATIGLTQILVPDTYRMFPVKILQLMQEKGVSFFLWVPTIMVNIANAGVLEAYRLPQLRVGWFAGEVCPPKQTNQWIAACPHTQFVNLYGPMEVTVICTYYDIHGKVDEDRPIPIGRAVDNYGVRLLTAEGVEVKTPGVEGEICVFGSVIAYGYYGLSEKTEEAFRPLSTRGKYAEKIYHTGDYGTYDERGEILFKGRKDSLVKHSGYRIELAEIEHIMFNVAKIAPYGCVVYDFQKREIVVVYESSEELSLVVVRKRLMSFLPKYIIPGRLLRMDQMVRNGAGKIDRALLNRQINVTE
ncbi:MAG: AMP-binding protein [Kiritimatiellia bacterium]